MTYEGSCKLYDYDYYPNTILHFSQKTLQFLLRPV